MQRPEYVYKYQSASRVVQILHDLTFYFAPVSQLNDLYEFRVRSLYTELPDSRRRVFAKRLVHDGWYDTTAEAMTALSDGSLDQQASEAYEYFIEQLNVQLAAIMRHSGVTCFSSQRNNQRMWATYGDNHAGAVIEFTTAPENSMFAQHLMPVLYIDTRPEICPSEFLSDRLTLDQWFCGALCCFKHWHWRDEMEWRLLLLADSPQATADRIVPFERTSITRVFLGPRISPHDEQLIRDAAGAHRPPIGVFKRVVDEFEAKEEPVGVEEIHSLNQLLYWADRSPGGRAK